MVAVSAGTRDSMAARQFISPQGIRVIPNGVESYQEVDRSGVDVLRKQYGLEACFVFGSVGRLASVKGWPRFLPEFARFVRQLKGQGGKKPRLLLVGDGPERAAIKQQAQDLGIGDAVIFAGFQKDPQSWLGLMDVFVLPSLSEGLSVALLEALESGIYSAVTDVGDCGRVVRDVGHGEVLSADPARWADQLLAIYQTAPSRRIRALSTSRDGRIYSQSHCLQSYEELYASQSVTRQTNPKH